MAPENVVVVVIVPNEWFLFCVNKVARCHRMTPITIKRGDVLSSDILRQCCRGTGLCVWLLISLGANDSVKERKTGYELCARCISGAALSSSLSLSGGSFWGGGN